jgi:hypothetical protein
MLHVILKKRIQVLVSVAVMSLLLTAAAVFAASQFIRAESGGTVNIVDGAELVIPPKSLKEDTEVYAGMKEKRDLVIFEFGPEGTRFSKPSVLHVSWQLISDLGDVEDLTLYGENGGKLKPKITRWGPVYRIKHFSLYYYRRR